MRAALLACALVAGCTPVIVGGAYECGPDQACPEGLRCDPTDSVCVVPAAVTPFACPAAEVAHEVDDTQAQAHGLGALPCASPAVELAGCVAPGGDVDWVAWTTAPGCPATTTARARVTFPVGSSPLALTLVDATGATLATDAPCAAAPPGPADVVRCLEAPVAGASAYALRVGAAGHDDCDGRCAYNRYALAVQLATP